MSAARMQKSSGKELANGPAIVSDAGVGWEAPGRIRPANPADGPAMAKVEAASHGAPSWPEEAYKQFKQRGYQGWRVEHAGGSAGIRRGRITAAHSGITT